MAQKQIALQQVRCGKQRDLPDALEKGQIGFSTDVGRLFIGLPSSSDPASIVAGRTWATEPNSGKENVEILTEFTPWEKFNDIINQPFVVEVAANATATTTVRSKTRIFLDYVAYDDSASILEAGTVQLVATASGVILAQNNNTNQADGLFSITFNNPSYDSSTKRMTISVTNSNSTKKFTIEFIFRGWDKP